MLMIAFGNNWNKNVHLGRYINTYTVGNFSFTVMHEQSCKTLFMTIHPTNIYTTQNENFEYGYPNSIAQYLCLFTINLYFISNWSITIQDYYLHKVACSPTKCDIIDDVKLFSTVYRGYIIANF